jgi:hypothetical protein
VRARAARTAEMVRETATLLVVSRGKEVEADQRASTLLGELVAARQEWDVTEEKVLILAIEATMDNQQREAVKE